MNYNDFKTIFLPTKIYKVDEHLLRGNAVFSPTKIIKIKKQNVNQIIDLRNDSDFTTKILKKFEQSYCKCIGIKYKNMPFSITPKTIPEMDFFEKINSQIINNNGRTYLHCHYGNHRTNISVAMYEKSKGKNDETILKDLIKNFWDNYSKKTKNYTDIKKSLEVFIKKYFPDFT